MVELLLPYPPTANHFWKLNRDGSRRLSDEYRAFLHKVGVIVMAEHAGQLMSGSLQAHYFFFPPDNRRRDIGNLEKAVSDSLVRSAVMVDDCQLNSITVERAPVVKGGLTLARISRMDNDHHQTVRNEQLIEYVTVLMAKYRTVDLLLPI